MLVGQTMVEVDLVGERYLTIPADSTAVQEGDIIGFEIETGKNVIQCENLPTSNLQQRSYIANVSDWYVKDNAFPTSAASDLDQTCYFHAIYTQDSAKNVTNYLGYFESTGSYSLSVEIPYSSYNKTLSVSLDEAISDIKWVYPVVMEQPIVSTSLGTLYIESGVAYNFTLSVGRGTTLSAEFTTGVTTSTENFQNSCPADVLAEVPNACDTLLIWPDYPFSYFRHAISTTGTQDLSVTISNSIDTETRTVTLEIAKRVTNVAISCMTSANNIIAINDAANFSATVGDGTGVSYAFAVDGAAITGTGDTMAHTFSAAGNFNVSVNVSNILGSSYASLSMTVILPANFQNCQFTSASYIAAVNVSLSISVTCEVALTSVVQASWSFSDRPSAPPLTSTETASISVTVTWTQAVVFPSASSSVTIDVTYTDLINTGSISTYVTVYEAVPSVNLVASPSKALVRQNINFTADIPPGSYGNLTFSFEFGNGVTDSVPTTDSSPSGEVSYFYTNPGSYDVKAIASNGPSQAEVTIQVIVVETILGLTITSDSPTKTTELTTFSVSVNQGNYGVLYNYRSEPAAFNTNVSQSSFSCVFPRQDNYTVNVTAMNGLTEESGSVLVYIMDETTIYAGNLQMDGGSFSGCIESNTEHEFSVSVIHFDIPGLLYQFDFGDSIGVADSSQSTVKHTYAPGNNYNLQLTVKYPPASAQVILSETVCVQDPISSPAIVVDHKIGLPLSGSITKTASVTVSGTSPIYSWATNASYSGSTTGSTFNLKFTATGFYFIDVNVSNEINSESAQTLVVEVLNAVSGLTITCNDSSAQPCFDKAGHKYVEKDDTFSVSGSIVSGDLVTYTWTFGDGSGSSPGQSVTKTYSSTGIYNVTVEVTNDAGSEIEYITVHVEERLQSVVLTKYGTTWLSNSETVKNMLTEFQAVESPPGMEVEYVWEFEAGLSPYSTTTDNAGYNYTSTGTKQCLVTVQNFLNSVNKTFDFYVIEAITSVNLKVNGAAVSGTSLSVAINRLIIFEIYANTNVKCTYMLSLRKNGKYVDNKANYTWEYTFSTLGAYTLDASVTNDLGSKQERFDITVIEEITNPVISVTAGGSSITLGTSIMFEGSAQGTSPIYTWSYKQAPAGESFPSNNTGQQITLTPAEVGTYIVLLSVTNDVTGPQTDEYTFVVMEAVSGVSILSSLVPADAVKINAAVTFTASVTNGSDLSYAWDIDSNTGSQSTFSFQFTAQKLYTVSVNVSNSASWKVETIQIYCLEEVLAFSLSVTGTTFQPSNNVAETGDTLDFSSSLVSTTFITFSWSLNTVSSGGATTFSNTFSTAGSYDIAVNASNKISFSTSQITVLIQDPISGLTVSNCLGTFAVNSDITLTASYVQGTDVTVTWDKESLQAASGNTTVINYVTPGSYTINATASNFVDTKEVSCQIEIQGKIDNLNLDHSKYLFAGYPVTFNVTGDFLDSASFSWTVSGNPTPDITTVPTWDYSFLTKGDYTVIVTVSNAVSSKNVSLKVTIKELECAVPTLDADGSTNRIATRASDVELSVRVSNVICSAYTSVNKWTLYIASSCSAALTNKYPLASDITTTTPSLNIPGKRLPYDTFCAVFEHSYKNTPVTYSVSFNLTIIESALIAIITGGDTKDVGEGSELQLDASESHDPDNTTGTTLSYTWACQVNTSIL